MTQKSNKRPVRSGENGNRLGKADWLSAARKALIADGVQSVKVDRLARRLKVTRGSFYWHFNSRRDLLNQLLQSWVSTNTSPFTRVLESGADGPAKFQAIADLWISEEEYDPRFDTAVREWARVSKAVGRVVMEADEARIEILRQIFLEIGYTGEDALVRARIAYFHQVGYYTLGIVESASRRQKLRPYYTRALIGTPP